MPIEDISDTSSPPLIRSLADGIVVHLREAIFTGQLASGERLREEVLAEFMDVSRGPIREALRQLEREGLVVIQRNRGTFVARLAREDLDEVYSLRLALERLAVQQAVRNVESKHLSEMQTVVDTMASYVDRGITVQEAAELDIRFHEILCQAGKHRRLYDFWTNLRPQIHIFFLSRNVANPDFREQLVHGHQAIVDVIQDRDEQRAIARLEEHFRIAYEHIAESYV